MYYETRLYVQCSCSERINISNVVVLFTWINFDAERLLVDRWEHSLLFNMLIFISPYKHNTMCCIPQINFDAERLLVDRWEHSHFFSKQHTVLYPASRSLRSLFFSFQNNTPCCIPQAVRYAHSSFLFKIECLCTQSLQCQRSAHTHMTCLFLEVQHDVLYVANKFDAERPLVVRYA
jgi:hypothetical protein